MGRAQVVRAEVVGNTIWLKLWVDDERGYHETVCELTLGFNTLVAWGNEILAQQSDAAQYQLKFD